MIIQVHMSQYTTYILFVVDIFDIMLFVKWESDFLLYPVAGIQYGYSNYFVLFVSYDNIITGHRSIIRMIRLFEMQVQKQLLTAILRGKSLHDFHA